MGEVHRQGKARMAFRNIKYAQVHSIVNPLSLKESSLLHGTFQIGTLTRRAWGLILDRLFELFP